MFHRGLPGQAALPGLFFHAEHVQSKNLDEVTRFAIDFLEDPRFAASRDGAIRKAPREPRRVSDAAVQLYSALSYRHLFLRLSPVNIFQEEPRVSVQEGPTAPDQERRTSIIVPEKPSAYVHEELEPWNVLPEKALYEPEAIPIQSDSVECSVFAPPTATRGQHLMVQVFAHLREDVEAVKSLASEFDDQSRPRARRELDHEVARGSRLTFHLSIRDLVVDDNSQTVQWSRRPGGCSIRSSCPNRMHSEGRDWHGVRQSRQHSVRSSQVRHSH